MARIIGRIGASHSPTIGFAKDTGKQNDPVWKPIFDGFDVVRGWVQDKKIDVLFMIYNDHITSFFFDHYSSYVLGIDDMYIAADEGGGQKQRDKIAQSVAGDQPQAGQQQLPADVGKGGQQRQADHAEPAAWQTVRQCQCGQTGNAAGKAEEKAGGHQAAEEQGSGKYPDQAEAMLLRFDVTISRLEVDIRNIELHFATRFESAYGGDMLEFIDQFEQLFAQVPYIFIGNPVAVYEIANVVGQVLEHHAVQDIVGVADELCFGNELPLPVEQFVRKFQLFVALRVVLLRMLVDPFEHPEFR